MQIVDATSSKAIKLGLVVPFENPHFVDLFRFGESVGYWVLQVFAFRDLPEHRKELGWKMSRNTMLMTAGWNHIFSLALKLRQFDSVVFLGMIDPSPYQTFLCMIAQLFGVRVVIASEGLKTPTAKRLPWIVRYVLNRPSVSLLAIGKGSADDYRELGLDKVSFYKFGFFERYELNAKKPQSFVKDELTILSVGQLIKRKNFASVVNALQKVTTSQKIVYKICGDGEELSALGQLGASLPENMSLQLLGNCNRDKLATIFNDADIFVMPSIYDGWGVVLNQAMHYQLPTIVSTGVRAAEGYLVEHGENGLLYESDDELVKQLEILINSSELRESLSRNCQASVGKWNMEACALRLYQWLSKDSSEVFQDGPLAAIT